MDLLKIRVKSFRTIKDEQEIDLSTGLTIVGPNNSGKTNILQAIQMMFTGYENIYSYSRERDLTFGDNNSRTSITTTFSIDPSMDFDKNVLDDLIEIQSLLGLEKASKMEYQLEIARICCAAIYRKLCIHPGVKCKTDN